MSSLSRSRLPALALLALLAGGAPAMAEPPACGAPPEAIEAAPMPGVAAAIARGTLRVMVVGSASTRGSGAAGGIVTWPERLQRLLGARLAPATVQVSLYGGRGTIAADHARIIAEEGPQLRPHLIIWQLGTVEAARGLPADDMAETVQDTVTRLRLSRGERTDLVLVDQQFSRFLRANADVETYRDSLRLAATASGAQVFGRWALMQHWVDTERLDLERAPRTSRAAVADELHECLAQALTDFILTGAQRRR